MTIVELAQGQRIGAGEADVPIHSGMDAVSRGSPQQNTQVIGQQLEFHLDADVTPVLLDGGDGVKQVACIVHTAQGVASIPASFFEQFFRLIGIVSILGQAVCLPGSFGNQRLVSSNNSIVPECINNGIHINGIP